MTWTKLDDNWDDSERLDRAAELVGDSAFAMWSRAVTFCNRQLTDGHIGGAKLRKLTHHKRPQAVVDALVSAGALVAHDGDSYEIHGFLRWNEPKEVVLAKREARRLAGQTGGTRSAAAKAEAKQEATNGQANACRTVGGCLDNVQADCNPLLSSPSASSKQNVLPPSAPAKRATRCPAEDDPGLPAWLAANGIPALDDRTYGREVYKFAAYHSQRVKDPTSNRWKGRWVAWRSKAEDDGSLPKTSSGHQQDLPVAVDPAVAEAKRKRDEAARADMLRQKRAALGLTGTEDA